MLCFHVLLLADACCERWHLFSVNVGRGLRGLRLYVVIVLFLQDCIVCSVGRMCLVRGLEGISLRSVSFIYRYHLS